MQIICIYKISCLNLIAGDFLFVLAEGNSGTNPRVRNASPAVEGGRRTVIKKLYGNHSREESSVLLFQDYLNFFSISTTLFRL